MKQINNGFMDYYYLTEEGEVYNEQTDHYIDPDPHHSFRLKTIDNRYKKISLKEIYKKVYGYSYCIDDIEDLEGEEWRDIKDCENYFVSSCGRVKSYAGYNAIILKPYVTKGGKGYNKVTIVKNGRRSCRLVSRLVAGSFLLPPEDLDCQLHHKNGNSLCDYASNLEWLTPEEHRKKHNQMKEKELENERASNSTKSTND